jgi:dihydropyrimidinase
MESRSDFDVFAGREIRGWPSLTLSRGEIVFQDGVVTGGPGRARRVRRGPYVTPERSRVGGRDAGA